ncbi:DUF4292 domain-containing protein [Polaribacter tangerinus]|uniref:DUF4292 domain-containing protein n=1 Tax=Polaribacter tangerinus TaxID=1920034 RepID=UPI000B4AEFC9|nr:DUF4292 domain-containing protein [Polaribacter tangerinus]
MKNIIYLFFLVLVFAACKSKSIAIDKSAIATKMSARRVVKKHIAANFSKETLDAKYSVNYEGENIKQRISVNIKIEIDKVIWLKGTKFINVFKAKITPNKVLFYSPLDRTYFDGDFSLLEEILGTPINFDQLQNLFLGQAILDLKKEKQEVSIENNVYVLSPKTQNILFDTFFKVQPSHFKLLGQSIVNIEKKQRLDISYSDYFTQKKEIFPSKMVILAKDNTKQTTIDFNLKSVIFNSDLNTSFKIPSGYKRIKL